VTLLERRISARKFIDVNVYVSLPGRAAISCQACDISESGIFLKAGLVSIPRLKQLQLVFALNISASNVIRMRHVSAMVVRAVPEGVGMAFRTIDNN